MKHIDLFNIKLNHIRIFLTAVELGGFTAAAEKLHLTQPFVSKSIQHLEEELGLYLIIRGSRKFQVTPAGKRLYEEWKDIMQNFENSLTSAHSIQSGLTDKFKIGLGALDPEDNVVKQNLMRTKEMLPGVDIYVESGDMATMLNAMLKREVDIIVISKHMLPMIEDTNLEWKTIIESYLSIYVHSSNPLFERETLEFADLKQEKFIVFSTENDDSYTQLLRRLGKEAGFKPQISCYVASESSFKINLEMGNGIVLADSYSNLESKNIKRFNLPLHNDVMAVWDPDNYRDGMRVFLSLFDE